MVQPFADRVAQNLEIISQNCQFGTMRTKILMGFMMMGWLRLVGSLKLQVSFAKEPYKREICSAKKTFNFKGPTNRSHPIIHMPQPRFVSVARGAKTLVSFAKEPCKRDDILQKSPIIVHMPQLHPIVPLCQMVWGRIIKIIGLFCKRALLKRGYSAKETYNFKEPTNRS